MFQTWKYWEIVILGAQAQMEESLAKELPAGLLAVWVNDGWCCFGLSIDQSNTINIPVPKKTMLAVVWSCESGS